MAFLFREKIGGTGRTDGRMEWNTWYGPIGGLHKKRFRREKRHDVALWVKKACRSIFVYNFVMTYYVGLFLAQQHMLSALYAIACPSVCLSVRHTDGSVKTVEVRIMKYSPYGSPIHLVLRDKCYMTRVGIFREFSRDFANLQIWGATIAKRMNIDPYCQRHRVR